MPNIADIIQKSRERKDPNFAMFQAMTTVQEQEFIRKMADALEEKIQNQVRKAVKEYGDQLRGNYTESDLKEILRSVKGQKGDKPIAGVDFSLPQDGYTPKKGKDYFDGQKPVAGVDYPIPKNGEDGKTPVKGKDYFDGLDGKPGDKGEKGEKGIDGSPDTPEEIAIKVNTLKEKIEQKTIKGLLGWMKGIQRLINEKSGGGGGMGNVVPETFATSAATTAITLSSAVASNGRAIWLNYQGQQQAYTTHFTVSGRTVNLNFTPENNTFIDVIYIRK